MQHGPGPGQRKRINGAVVSPIGKTSGRMPTPQLPTQRLRSVMKSGRLRILLVEDEDNDIFLVQRATERGGAGHRVYPVRDGEEAIHYLRGQGMYADRQKFPLPNVILSDLKMQRMDGFEFLQWLRSHPECS